MPHITTYGGSYFSAQSEKDSFGSFEPRQAKLQEAFTNDQLTGVKGGQEGEEFSDTQPPSAMHQGAMNSVQAMDEAGNLLDNAGNGTANIGGTSGPSGSSFPVHKCIDISGRSESKGIVHPQYRVGVTAGPGVTSFMTETFEPAPGLDSFGESFNPVLEIGGTAGLGGTSFMTGKTDFPADSLGGRVRPAGNDI